MTDCSHQIRTSPSLYYVYSEFEVYTPTAHDESKICLTDPGPGNEYNFGDRFGEIFNQKPITLTTPLYQSASGGAIDNAHIPNIGDVGYQSFPSDFYNYILSNSALIASYPFLKTCYTAFLHGPPSVKVRVSALTADNYNTVTSSGLYSTSGTFSIHSASPAPGSVAPGPAASTAKPSPQPTISPSDSHPVQASSTQASRLQSSSGEPRSDPGPQSTNSRDVPAKSDVSYVNPQPSPKPATQFESNPSAGSSVNGAIATYVGIEPSGLSGDLNGQFFPPVITIGGASYTAQPDSNYYIGTNTLIPGGPPITIANTPYSLAPLGNGLAIGGSTVLNLPGKITNPTSPNAPIITLNGQKLTPDPASHYAVGSHTLIAGGPAITVNNALYSLAPSATALISGTSTLPLLVKSSNIPDVRTVDGKTYMPNAASKYVIGSVTLLPGGAAVTINGATYSLALSGTALISGSSTIPIKPPSSPLPTTLTIDGSVYSGNSASQYVVGSQTLSPNGPAITIGSIPYSLSVGPSGVGLISGTSTSLLSPVLPTNKAGGIITIGGTTYTANSASGFVIDGQMLSPGAAITVSGTKISLGAMSTDVVVGTSTETVGLGSLIMGGFGSGSLPTATAAPSSGNGSVGHVAFTGHASRIDVAWGRLGGPFLLGMALLFN